MISISPEELKHSFIFRTPLIKPAGVLSFEKTINDVLKSFIVSYHAADRISKKAYIDVYPEHNELLCEVEHATKNLKGLGFNAELIKVDSTESISNHSSDVSSIKHFPEYFYVRIHIILEVEKCDMTVDEALKEAYAFDRKDEGRLAARTIMLFIETNILNSRIEEINNFLGTADISQLKTRSLIGMMRTTYRIREYLPNWKETYFKARDRITELGKDPQALFIGINDIVR